MTEPLPARAQRLAAFVLAANLTTLVVPAWVTWSHQPRAPQAWWALLLVVATAATAMSWWVWKRDADIRPLAGTLYLTGLVGVASLLVWRGEPYGGSEPPWIVVYHPTAVAMVPLLSRRPRAVVLGATVVIAPMVAVNLLGIWRPDGNRAVLDILFDTAVLAICYAVVMAVEASEAESQAEQQRAIQNFARARAAESVARGHTRWDALTHDEVLAALVMVQLPDAPLDGVQRAASRAAAAISDPDQGRTVIDLKESILDAVLTTYPLAATDLRVEADAGDLPATVSIALVEATTEALRNVARHAYPRGAGAATVALRHDASGVRITVRDGGCGFDPGHVPALSLGLELSITRRMLACHGSSRIHTRVGEGTVVELAWPDQARA